MQQMTVDYTAQENFYFVTIATSDHDAVLEVATSYYTKFKNAVRSTSFQ